MAAGNRHLGYKELLNEIEERSPGTKAAFVFGFLERGARTLRRRRGGGTRGAAPVPGVRRAHPGRRVRVLPAARPAPSRQHPGDGRDVTRRGSFVAGRTGAARRQQAAAPPRDARGRRPVPHARRHRRPRRPDRPPRRHHRAHDARRAPRRGAADARRVRARDAARRAGDLPEGPRADPHARRHLPRRAHPRVGRRLGRAHDRAAARDRADRVTSPATRSATTSRSARCENVHGFLGDRRAARRRGARRLRRHRRTRPRPHRARPARAVARREARADALGPAGSCSRTCRRSCRSAGCARSSPTRRSAWSRRSRCCSAGWHVEGQSIRPDHRMVAHTGFLTARPPARARYVSAPSARERARPRRSSCSPSAPASAAGASASSRACFAWAGVVAGLAIGVRLRAAGRHRVRRHQRRRTASAVAVLFLFLVAIARPDVRPRARAARAPRRSRCRKPLPLWDRVAGAAVGALGVLVAAVAGHPVARHREGWPARMARGSCDRRRDPALGAAANRRSSRRGARRSPTRRIPSALGHARSRRPNPGPPPGHVAHARGRRARARVDREGDGQRVRRDPGRERLGRGAGHRRHERARRRGGARDDGHRLDRQRRCRRSSIAFDPVRDVAVLSVPGAATPPPLPLATRRGRRRGAVYGHPGRRRAAVRAGAHRRRDRRGRHRHLPHRRRAAGTCTCSPRRSRPATPAARS